MKKIIVCLITLILITSCNKNGCTDPLADNYSSTAKKDDNSCKYSVASNWEMSTYILNGVDETSYYSHYKLHCYSDSSFWTQSLIIDDTLTRDTSLSYTTIFMPDTLITLSDTTIYDTLITLIDTIYTDTTITLIDTLIYGGWIAQIDTQIVDTLIFDSLTIDIIGNYSINNAKNEFYMQNQNTRTTSNFSSGNNWLSENNSNNFLINLLSDSLMHLTLINSSDPGITSLEIIYNKK
jgi:hypothetical protein